MKTSRTYLAEFDGTHHVTTNFELLKNITDTEFHVSGSKDMPILNEKFIDLLEVSDFRTFKALMKSFATETALPEQLQIDEKFMKKLSKSGIAKRILPGECPEIYNFMNAGVLNKGIENLYFCSTHD